MTTIRWKNIVFGPIFSRRLGTSLGVNLLPTEGKICSFDCIYCECGWNKDGRTDAKLPSKEDVANALEWKLKELASSGTAIDSITFSGNGEPTLHPDFVWIIDHTIALRNLYAPSSKISVLSNATRIGEKGVREALMKIENPILKIDGGDEDFAKLINRPGGEYSVKETISNLLPFKGNFILQTMFLRGNIDGKGIDSTDPALTAKWVELVLKLRPKEVMIYTIDRETPAKELQKVSVEDMEKIAEPLRKEGIKVQIRG